MQCPKSGQDRGPVFVQASVVLEVAAQEDFVRSSENRIEVYCGAVDDVEIGSDRHAVIRVVNPNLMRVAKKEKNEEQEQALGERSVTQSPTPYWRTHRTALLVVFSAQVLPRIAVFKLNIDRGTVHNVIHEDLAVHTTVCVHGKLVNADTAGMLELCR